MRSTMAKAADARIAFGRRGAALEGLPIGVKDLYATRGRAHAGLQPHPRKVSSRPTNPPSRRNLWRDGAVMLGKLNMDEFAMGSSNETSVYGPCRLAVGAAGSQRETRRARCARRRPKGVACARRLLGRVGRRSRGASLSWARPPRTPAARSASRPPSPAPSASSRPTDVARAGAWSPSPPRSIRRAPSRAPSATRRSCCARWSATIPKDATSVTHCPTIPRFEEKPEFRGRRSAPRCAA